MRELLGHLGAATDLLHPALQRVLGILSEHPAHNLGNKPRRHAQPALGATPDCGV